MKNLTNESTILVSTPTTIDGETYYTCSYGKFKVEESRFGLYNSVDDEGSVLITGLTEEAVISGTPLHLYANSSDYRGEYDCGKFSSSVGVKL